MSKSPLARGGRGGPLWPGKEKGAVNNAQRNRVETIRFNRTIPSRGDNPICDGLYVPAFAQKSHWGIMRFACYEQNNSQEQVLALVNGVGVASTVRSCWTRIRRWPWFYSACR